MKVNNRIRKCASFVLVLLLILGMFSPVFASLEGGVGGGGGSGAGSGGSVPKGSPTAWHSYGYRIYLAKNTNESFVNLSTNKWGNNGNVKPYLWDGGANSRPRAVYELYGTKSTSYVHQNMPIRSWLGNGRFSDVYESTPGSNKSSTTSFSNLFKGTSFESRVPTLPLWSYEQTNPMEPVADWANKVFKDEFTDPADINKFLDNYKQVLSSQGVSSDKLSNLPKDASGFEKEEWGIVFEPVMVASINGVNMGFALGFQDIQDFYKAIGVQSKPSVHFSSTRMNNLGGMFVDFVAKSTDKRITTKNTVSKGFGYFLGSEMDFPESTEHGASYNVLMQAPGYKGVMQDAIVSVGSGMSSYFDEGSDLLGMGADLDTYAKIKDINHGSFGNLNLAQAGLEFNESFFDSNWEDGATYDTRSSLKNLTGIPSLVENNKVITYTLSSLGGIDQDSYNMLKDQSIGKIDVYELEFERDTQVDASYIQDATSNLSDIASLSEVRPSIKSVDIGDSRFRYGQIFTGNMTVNSVDLGKNLSSHFNGLGLNPSLNKVASLTGDNGDAVTTLAKLQAGGMYNSTVNFTYDDSDPSKLNVEAGKLYLTIAHAFDKKEVESDINSVALVIDKDDANRGIARYSSAGTGSEETVQYDAGVGGEVQVTDTKNSSMNKLTGSSNAGTFAIVWEKSGNSLGVSDAEVANIVNDLQGNTSNIIQPSNSGAVILKNAFRDATGINPTVSYLGGAGLDQTLAVGASMDGAGDLDGYNVLVVSVDRFEMPAMAGATLKPHEVNYVFPDLRGDNSSSASLFRSVFAGRKADNYKVYSSISGNGLVGTYGNEMLYYNPGTGNFDVPNRTTKTFSSPATASHAFNLTRAMFEDDIVLSEYRNANLGRLSDITKLNQGYTGTNSPLGGNGDGREFISNHKQDSFSWTADKTYTEVYYVTRYRTKYDEDGEPYQESYQSRRTRQVTEDVPFRAGHLFQNNAQYDLTTATQKYTPSDIAVSALESDDEGKVLDTFGRDQGAWSNGAGMLTQSEETLKFYPEVEMVGYLPRLSGSGDGNQRISGVTRQKVFAMGDKQRELTPVTVRMVGLHTDSSDPVSASLVSDTIATDPRANELSSRFSGEPVLYAGGNLNLQGTFDGDVVFASYALDLRDPHKANFDSGNSGYDPEAEHSAWVDADRDKINIDFDLEVSDMNGNYLTKYNNFNVRFEELADEREESDNFNINFSDGEIETDTGDYNAWLSAMAEDYGATTSQVEGFVSAFEDQMASAVETRNDSFNNSSSQILNGVRYNKWYDEQSTAFVVKRNASVLSLGDFLLTDKLDIDAGPGGTEDSRNLFSDGYLAEWFVHVYMNDTLEDSQPANVYNPSNGSTFGDGVSDGTVMLNKGEITRLGDYLNFIIPDATTADMRSW